MCQGSGHYCLACGLKQVCEKYTEEQLGRGLPIDVQQLRKELARLFEDRDKFQLNLQADAMEALMSILQCLHAKAIGSTLACLQDLSDRKCDPPCISHSAFNLELFDQYHCLCGSSSELQPWDFSSFQLPLYTGELLDLAGPSISQRLTEGRCGVTSIVGALGDIVKDVDVRWYTGEEGVWAVSPTEAMP